MLIDSLFPSNASHLCRISFLSLLLKKKVLVMNYYCDYCLVMKLFDDFVGVVVEKKLMMMVEVHLLGKVHS